MARNIGGSLLPSGSPEVYRPKVGKHGEFETRPLPDLDTHMLFYRRNDDRAWQMVAEHANGYSCDALAKRIIIAWDGGSAERALEQFDFVLQCGGMGRQRSTIESLVAGAW